MGYLLQILKLTWAMRKLYLFVAILISICVPRSKKIWVFGENELSVLEPLFKYSSSKNDGIKKFYICNDERKISKLNSKGFNALNSDSFLSYYYISRAKLHFICKSKLTDLHNYLSQRAIKINLFHGTPLKAIGLACVKNRENKILRFFNKQRLNKLKKRYSKYRFLCATSPFTRQIYSKCFGIDEKSLKLVGHPRNDLIANRSTNRKFISKNIGIDICNYSMVFSYMPTWRKDIWNNKINFNALNKFLSSKNAILYIRPHHLDASFENVKGYSNILITEYGNKPSHDAHCDLLGTDVLISDYSSLIHDFLLTNRPIIIYTPDYNTYKKTTKFSVDYETNIPIKAATKFDDLIKNMADVSMNKYDYGKYKRLLDKYHSYQDANSTARLYREIKDICSS